MLLHRSCIRCSVVCPAEPDNLPAPYEVLIKSADRGTQSFGNHAFCFLAKERTDT